IAESVASQLWPLLNLPGSPHFADDEAMKILKNRHNLLKLAWLSETGHKRPGVPAGLALDEAKAQATTLLEKYRVASQVKTTTWHGYERLDFIFDGRAAILVKPKSPASGHPWIWRTEFFGH